jgi:hypothetical protein
MDKICLNCDASFDAKRERAKFCSDLCRATFYQTIKMQEGGLVVKIYGLVDPTTKNVFYIGRTVNSLEVRLKAHLKNNENAAKVDYINLLAEKGITPSIIELERVSCSTEEDETNALLREDFWIKKYLQEGFKLCNVQGVGNVIKPRLLSSYQKATKKSSPATVRFNAEYLDFIFKREPSLKSKQMVVDFLLEAYYKTYRVQPNNPFEHPLSSQGVNQTIKVTESVAPLKLDIPKVSQFDAYLQEISETTWSGDLEVLMAEAKKEKDISPQQQIKLQMFAMEHAKTFVN